LTPGSYTLEIGDKKQIAITVKDDPQLARERAQELATKLKQEDAFSEYVFRKYPTRAVTDVLMKDLLSDNAEIVERAAFNLERLLQFPADADAIVRKSMEKQLKMLGRQQNRSTGAVIYLSKLAGKIGTDQALAAVLALAVSHLDGETRSRAMTALGQFKQEQAVRELREFLKDADERVRFYAARTLAKSQDPAAIPVLVKVAGDAKSQWRPYALEELAHYPNSPEAIAALKDASVQ